MFLPLSGFSFLPIKLRRFIFNFVLIFLPALFLTLIFLQSTSRAQEPDETLQGVSVSATKFINSTEYSPQDVTILTSKELKRGGFTTITDAIDSVMGANVNYYGNRGAVATVSIQGSTSEQVLILINGKRLNSPSLGNYNLNELPITLNDVKSIEVFRGISTAIYGNDAMGGVINIITKSPSKKITASGTVSFGSFGTEHTDALISGQSGIFGYVVSGENETSGGFRANTEYGLKNFDGRFKAKLAKNASLEFEANCNNMQEEVPGMLTYPTPGAWEHDENGLYSVRLNINALHINLYSNNSRTNYYYDLNYPPDSLTQTTVHTASIKDSFIFGNYNIVTVGGDATEEKMNGTVVGIKDRVIENGFAQDELNVNNKFIATLGARYDNFNTGQHILIGNISAMYRFETETSVKMSAGTGFSLPTFDDLYWPNDGYEVGNPNLQPEKSREYEISVEQAIGKNFTATVLGFRKSVNDLIQWEEVPSGLWMPLNINNAKISGLEIVGNYIFKEIDLSMNYFYQNPQDEKTGQPIPYMPKESVKGSISYATDFGLTVSLGGNYTDDYVSAGNRSLSYFYLNGKISQRVPIFSNKANSEIFLAGNNILNRSYQVNDGYPMPPASVTAGLTVSF